MKAKALVKQVTRGDLSLAGLAISLIFIVSTLQFKYVLEVELRSWAFISAAVIAVAFSFVMVYMRILRRTLKESSAHMMEMNQEVTALNRQLSQRLSDRTQLLDDVKGQLGDMQQMAAMSSLSEGAIQKLNSSLMIISSAWEELNELTPLEAQTSTVERELRRELHEGVQQALSYATRYQELRIHSSRAEEVSILDVVDRLTPFLSRSFVSGQQLSVQWENRGPCKLQMPLPRFVQVLLNLVDNAHESLEGRSGKVTIKLILLSKHGGDCLQISVTDNGRGMSEAVKERATEAFFTTKDSGVGLGLHVSLIAVREAGGFLMISSAEGAGTMIRMILPCVE